MLKHDVSALLSASELKILRRLSTPASIQDFLDLLAVNFETRGETYMSPRRTLAAGIAHCFEGALLAALALKLHGRKPLLMDFQTGYGDEDHVVAIFKQNGLWGAISKTNHAVLRYRDAVYKTPRELAMSYFHEYFTWKGVKSMVAYSAPFDLDKYTPEKWITATGDLYWLIEDLDASRHFPVISNKMPRSLRRASEIELKSLKLYEWKPPQSFKRSA